MSHRSDMLRRLASLVALLALTTQAFAQAIADVAAVDQTQHHCDHQGSAQDDCACCPDNAPMSECDGLCSMMSALVSAHVETPRIDGEHVSGVNDAGAPGPTYLPLNPPPIA